MLVTHRSFLTQVSETNSLFLDPEFLGLVL